MSANRIGEGRFERVVPFTPRQQKLKKVFNMDYKTYFHNYPNHEGRFGEYGGAYLPDDLKKAFEEIDYAYQTICRSSQFINELRRIRKEFQGRPTPVYHCNRLSRFR